MSNTIIKKGFLMKIIIFNLLILLIVSGCCCTKDKESADIEKKESKSGISSNEGSETVEVKLPTIQCGTCKKNITKSLKKVDGIEEFDISVDDKIVTVSFDKSKTKLADIENAIVMTGYQANDKPANPEAYEKLDDCCKIGGHD